MRNISTLVPLAIAGVLLSAMVLAAPLDGSAVGTPAKAPNRADLFVGATCSEHAAGVVSQPQGWHNALGSKLVHDRAVTLAEGNPDLATGCDAIDA